MTLAVRAKEDEMPSDYAKIMKRKFPHLTRIQHGTLRALYRRHPYAWINIDYGFPYVHGSTLSRLIAHKMIEMKRDGLPRDLQRFCRLTKDGLALSRRMAGT